MCQDPHPKNEMASLLISPSVVEAETEVGHLDIPTLTVRGGHLGGEQGIEWRFTWLILVN